MAWFKKKKTAPLRSKRNDDIQRHNFTAALPDLVAWQENQAKEMEDKSDYTLLNIVCDWGSSTRLYAEHLDAGSHVIGLNNSAIFTARAIERVDNPKASFTFTLDLSHLDFPDNHFDRIIMDRASKYIRNIEPVIAELARVLKPKGTLSFLMVLDGRCQIEPAAPELLHALEKPRVDSVTLKQFTTCLEKNTLKLLTSEPYAANINNFTKFDQYFDAHAMLARTGMEDAEINAKLDALKRADQAGNFHLRLGYRFISAQK